MKGYTYQSDFAKKYVAEGRDLGLAEGLLTVLQVRGIAVPESVRTRILAEREPEQLKQWLEKAVAAASITEVIDEPS